MPITKRTVLTAGSNYGRPFVGSVNHPAQIRVNVALLTSREVDAYGYLKPGVPLAKTGILVGAAPAYVYGVVPEPIKVAESNAGADLTAAGNVEVTVHTHGQVNRAIIEDNLGAVLTANEIAGFVAAGSHINLME